jgi:RNA polymerase sigma factor (sigma-70 family)
MSVDQVPVELIERAQAGDDDAFRALTEPYRRELNVHCYRMLGSLQDAEDALQETLLAAWLGIDGFEGRSSVRTWLYRIATNRCLNLLRSSSRSPTAAAPLPVPAPDPTGLGEVPWLQPYPDDLLEGLPDRAPGPDARYARARRPQSSGLPRTPSPTRSNAPGRRRTRPARRSCPRPAARRSGRCSTASSRPSPTRTSTHSYR